MNLQVGVKALLQQDGKFLFLRRNKDFKAGPQKWDIPGGRIEPEEPLEEALAREITEETGLVLKSLEKLLAAQDIFVEVKNLHVVRLTYSASAEGDVVISDEHDEHRWMSLDEILAEPNVDSYLQQVLRKL